MLLISSLAWLITGPEREQRERSRSRVLPLDPRELLLWEEHREQELESRSGVTMQIDMLYGFVWM